jgi:hypothetical protein
MVEQHSARDGAEHLGRDVRFGGGDAVGGSEQTAGAMNIQIMWATNAPHVTELEQEIATHNAAKRARTSLHVPLKVY